MAVRVRQVDGGYRIDGDWDGLESRLEIRSLTICTSTHVSVISSPSRSCCEPQSTRGAQARLDYLLMTDTGSAIMDVKPSDWPTCVRIGAAVN
jgi:hypothetical protein